MKFLTSDSLFMGHGSAISEFFSWFILIFHSNIQQHVNVISISVASPCWVFVNTTNDAIYGIHCTLENSMVLVDDGNVHAPFVSISPFCFNDDR